jgi:predicted phage terminase large subunit-like protein
LWHAVEPETPFIDGWVIYAICKHLQAVSERKIRRLLINVPPGFSKSLCSNVFYPAWEWGPRRRPHLRYVTASYSSGLTERDNTRMQQVALSELYQRYWGDAFNGKPNIVKFSNNRTGWKLATSVGGIGTGERGDRVIIDDPNNVKVTESKIVRESTNQWLREVMPTRLNSPTKSAVICIQQRTHEEDASGTLLSGKRHWCHVMVPMRYDPDRHCTTYTDDGTPFWSDPRRVPGELAWPERFPMREVQLLEGDLGEYATAGQFAQMPMPRGGGIIKRDWWQIYGPDDPIAAALKFPAFSFVLASLDTAYTAQEENDPSALVVMGVWTHPDTGYQQVMLIYAWHERLALHDLVQRVAYTCDKYRVDRLLIENKAAGHSVQQELRRLFAGAQWGVQFTDPTRLGEKEARAHSVSHIFEEKMVYRPNTEWGLMVEDEISIFPRGSHDDFCDAVFQGLRMLRDNGLLSRKQEQREQERSLAEYRSKGQRRALYAA